MNQRLCDICKKVMHSGVFSGEPIELLLSFGNERDHREIISKLTFPGSSLDICTDCIADALKGVNVK